MSHAVRTAWMMILALLLSTLLSFWLLDITYIKELFPFNIDNTGGYSILFSLNALLIFDFLILAIESTIIPNRGQD